MALAPFPESHLLERRKYPVHLFRNPVALGFLVGLWILMIIVPWMIFVISIFISDWKFILSHQEEKLSRILMELCIMGIVYFWGAVLLFLSICFAGLPLLEMIYLWFRFYTWDQIRTWTMPWHIQVFVIMNFGKYLVLLAWPIWAMVWSEAVYSAWIASFDDRWNEPPQLPKGIMIVLWLPHRLLNLWQDLQHIIQGGYRRVRTRVDDIELRVEY